MEKKFLEFVAGIFGTAPENISLESRYGETENWDSLMQLRLVAEIYDEYDVDIPIDEVTNIRTLGDFYRYIAQ